ncbi:T6SS immunity protein Tdi1 domain-containing protein [Bartonella apis]|jgi:Uncharacterized conserved protein|uniref:T6SS immunity protein Tdi1 domain-containing protein n=1 Tax=Bartonella apis TaxID=1686310 RepID=UPI00095C356C|nr:T6SS immunity protein Tdi1 domain-containing protein [Bartonella apis]OLY48254.1 hypothetical protein PEB0122_013770 [Bartonella apis]
MFSEKNRLPIDSLLLSPDVSSRMHEIFPHSFAQFLDAFGFCSFFNRGFQLCDPDDMRSISALIFGTDKDFYHKDVHVYGYSAFGVLYCWSNKLNYIRIDLINCRIFCGYLVYKQEVKASLDHMASGLLPPRDSIEYFDYYNEPLLERCIERYRMLNCGQCYGFFPALALVGGGESFMNKIENIKKVEAREHFAILSQLAAFTLTGMSNEGYVNARNIG